MIKFGTGGWRAIIGDEFTKENICILAKAMADKMICEQVDGKGVVIGYDRRFLSREAVIWSCEVLAAAGIKCYFVNRSVPTPLIMGLRDEAPVSLRFHGDGQPQSGHLQRHQGVHRRGQGRRRGSDPGH